MKTISNREVQKVYYKKSLTGLKDQAHYYFDQLWKHGYVERNECYGYLAKYLDIPESKAHMKYMTIDQCKQVITWAVMLLNDNRRCDLDFGAPINHPYYELI